MNEDQKYDAVENLVGRCLDQEAATVDSAALLARVRRTRRMRRIRRHAIVITAAAAVVVIAVTVALIMRQHDRETSPTEIGHNIAKVFQGQQDQATEGVETILSATDDSLSDALGRLPEWIPSGEELDLSKAVGKAKASLKTDVKEIRSKVKTWVSDSLGKAGLFI